VATLTPPEHKDAGRLAYMRRVWDLEGWFGVTFFRGAQNQFANLPEDILIGVNEYGLSLYEIQGKVVATRFHLVEIFRWGYRPNTSFYFEVKVFKNNRS